MKIDNDFRLIFTSFVGWRIILFAFILAGIYLFPLQFNFLGGGLANYLSSPFLWAWANFDGEHYLSIAQIGYGFAEQAFFPFYPLLIKLIGSLFAPNLTSLNLIGQLISNISFVFAVVGIYKLIKLDYSKNVANLAVLLLLLFPTSFYFVSVYTESLFLALVVWAFYFARKGKWWAASLLGLFASGTRVIGVILLPVLFFEWYVQKKRDFKKLLFLLLVPVGLFIYMYYLRETTGDGLAFLKSLPSFGEQRSATPIIFPQVFYRYFVKIIPSLTYSYFPVVFTTFLELTVAMVFLAFSVVSFWKLRLSYALYLLLGYLIPTLSGSFSSLPRYVLVLFPAFIIMALGISKMPRFIQLSFFVILIILSALTLSLFSRGYWIS